MELQKLGLSVMTSSILWRYGHIESLEELRLMTKNHPEYMKGIRNIGKRRLAEIRSFLRGMEAVIPNNNHTKEEPEIQTKCHSCHRKLKRLPWNTKGDLLICDNLNCLKYHTPQGFIECPREVSEIGKGYCSIEGIFI